MTLLDAVSRLISGEILVQAERKLLARFHPAYFAWIYLRDDEGNPLRPAPVHWEWYDLVLELYRGAIRSLCILAPKGHAKSTIIGKVVALWLIVCDSNIRGITGSVNSELAERFHRAIRRELEKNALLIEDFGPFKPADPEKWTQSELIVNRSSASPSPTWRAVGSQKAVQGGRSDWVIGDDLVDIENAMVLRQRDKFEEWFEGDFLGTLEPDGRTLIVGTAKNVNDQYHRIEEKSKDPASGWVFRRYDAIVDEGERRVLWPQRWSWDALMRKKASIGALTFNRDYRNIAINDETSLFPMRLLNAAKNPNLTFALHCDEGTVVAGIDYAVVEDANDAQASDSNYSVLTVWLIADSGKRRLLWGERWRGVGFKGQQDKLVAALRRYETLEIAVSEANQAQRWMASSILTASRGTLPIYKHTTGKLKADLYVGIPSMSALFEAGMIELPYGDETSREFVDVFIAELFGLGVETHDDTVMSFYMSDIGVRRLVNGPSWTKVSTKG